MIIQVDDYDWILSFCQIKPQTWRTMLTPNSPILRFILYACVKRQRWVCGWRRKRRRMGDGWCWCEGFPTSADRLTGDWASILRFYIYVYTPLLPSCCPRREKFRVWDEQSGRIERGVASSLLRPVLPLTQVDCPGNGPQKEDLTLGCCGGDVFAVIAALNVN